MSRNKNGSGQSPNKTGHLRTKIDLVKMAGQICEVTGQRVSDYVDPLIRPTIEADHERFRVQIDAMERARVQARKKLDE